MPLPRKPMFRKERSPVRWSAIGFMCLGTLLAIVVLLPDRTAGSTDDVPLPAIDPATLVRAVEYAATALPAVKMTAPDTRVEPAAMKAAVPPPTAALDPAPTFSLRLGLDPEDHSIQLDTEQLTRQWADAWAKKDVARYISFYSPDYSSPPELPRESWIEGRRRRILQAQELTIQITRVEVTREGDEVSVRFQQHYRTTRINAISNKILRWRRLQNDWKIIEEKIFSEIFH